MIQIWEETALGRLQGGNPSFIITVDQTHKTCLNLITLFQPYENLIALHVVMAFWDCFPCFFLYGAILIIVGRRMFLSHKAVWTKPFWDLNCHHRATV